MKLKKKIIQIKDCLASIVKHTKRGYNIQIVRENNSDLILKLMYKKNDSNRP